MSLVHLAPSLILTVAFLFTNSTVRADDWPQWRGPAGNSVSREVNLPIAWSESGGIEWKAELPEFGNSTPIIIGKNVFITSHVGSDLKLLCLDADKGAIRWSQTVGAGEAPRTAEPGRQKFHDLQNLASASPVATQDVVVAHFGNGDLAAYDFAGKQLWKRNLQEDFAPYSIWWGHANSPVIFENMVISVCMQDRLSAPGEPPLSPSYVVAHDLKTGKQVWQVDRNTNAKAEECDSYTTPVFYTKEGLTQMLVMGGNELDSYNPATGARLWYVPGLFGGRTVTGPTVALDMVFVTQGMRGPLCAIKIEGAGKREASKAIEWKERTGSPDTCCPVVWEDMLFTVSDDGIARCFDPYKGILHWKERLKGDYKASPVAADGRIYFLNTSGLCTIITASHRYSKLTENQLSDKTLASPAIANGKVYIRGHKSLYCIGR